MKGVLISIFPPLLHHRNLLGYTWIQLKLLRTIRPAVAYSNTKVLREVYCGHFGSTMNKTGFIIRPSSKRARLQHRAEMKFELDYLSKKFMIKYYHKLYPE